MGGTTMQRRKFLIGAGALAAGSAAAMGSGAFSAMQAGRDADINVVNDASGLIALNDETPSDVIREEDGQLLIDFTADGSAGGVNVDSRYQVGVPGGLGFVAGQAESEGFFDVPVGQPVGPDPAFLVVNQDSIIHDVTLEYEADASDVGGSELFLYFVPGVGGNSQAGKGLVEVSGTNTTASYTADLSPGSGIAVVLFVDTRDGSTTDDLSGTLTVSAD